ncbi:MAG TPA: alpha-amylase family glycosyl hydrolase [Geothrix sp.]|nr:alpha-amylase family glycosyl hydrolase [Geothrix sp.]
MSKPDNSSFVSRALTLAIAMAAAALPLLAQAPVAVPGTFAENPIVYFVMTDRFYNGNPANDQSYGRQREASPKADVGTFHGGDLKGLTLKLKEGWFKNLGVNALWITAPYEQIHGWVQGGQKQFKHYAYHGYYALDYTVLDKNMGTPDELRELVDTAHSQGIRILFDIVMNHPGYLDIQTAKDLKINVLWPDWDKDANLLRNYHSYIDYNSDNFGDWWGRPWVRAGLPGYMDGGRNDFTMQLAYLPDFRTESTEFVKLPKFLKGKADTKAVDLPNTTVRGYLIKWLTDWVREFGIDGFRADTVKHVEPEAWAALKAEAVKALAEFKAKNPTRKVDDAPFWMVGEYWGAGPERHKLAASGFDAMINFDFQQQEGAFSKPEKLFKSYAQAQAGQPVHMLNYLSSHDTELFDRERLVEGGTALLLAPGGVQIFYGDETARPLGPEPSTDKQQGTRSDMNWAAPDAKVLAHWRKLGTFRARHRALATGEHKQLSVAPYTFSRVDAGSGDRVVVALDAKGQVSLPVAGIFEDGETLHDAYSGRTAQVVGGKVALQAEQVVLLERVQSAAH